MGERPPRAGGGPTAGPAGPVCRACGWPNRPNAVTCEFCTRPLQPLPAPPPRPRPVRCPHCRAASFGADPLGRCPECGTGYLLTPTPLRVATARASRLLRKTRIGPLAVVVGLFVALAIVNLAVVSRGQAKAFTADHIRQIKQRLEIFEGENGGYPPNLEALEPRYGPLPHDLLLDGWERPIRYLTFGLPLRSDERGLPLFQGCEVRSAGSNGRPGDADDIVWRGAPSEPIGDGTTPPGEEPEPGPR